MVINPLPQATIHLLGSSQTLTTPLSLVKELIDNSLDANATSIDVSISQNTLDKVEVRDNGHGISPNDLDALGRPSHTSKLRSFEEIRSIGGASLGFRGEALASAAQLGQVSVTTKTDGEVVATCAILKPAGGILKQTRTSHPVGTTACVKGFLSKIPIRQQTAMKAAPKTLVKIKELLQSYALARPTVKFSLKVMKESKSSWSFVPRPNEGFRGVVQQAIGRSAAMECVEQSFSFPERKASRMLTISSDFEESECHAKGGGFFVEMFLPKPDANLANIGQGQYLSVDSRPIANDKGTMRKIVALFKSYLRGCHGETSDTVKNPFFRMNLVCPVGSYDPNVEPGKDDLLFGDEEFLIGSIEIFFKGFYGEHSKATAPSFKKSSEKMPLDFKLLLAKESPAPHEMASKETSQLPTLSPTSSGHSASDTLPMTRQSKDRSVEEEELLPSDEGPAPSHRSKWGVDMSNDLSEEVEGSLPQDRGSPEGISSHEGSLQDHNRSDLNPWSIAKLTAHTRPSDDIGIGLPLLFDDAQQSEQFPATPRPSDPPTLHDAALVKSTQRPRKAFNPCQITPQSSDNRRVQIHALQEKPPVRKRSLGSPHETELLLGDDAITFARRNDFTSARNVIEEDLSRHKKAETIKVSKKYEIKPNKPMIPTMVNVENNIPRDALRQTTLQKPFQIPRFQQNVHEGGDHPDLAWSMDFEHRKAELTRQQRQKAKTAIARGPAKQTESNGEESVTRVSPHKNRYDAALATLSQEQSEAVNVVEARPKQSLIPEGDPRAYLIRRQNSFPTKPGEASKVTRTRSNRLPLERVPQTEELHALMLNVPIGIDIVRKFALVTGEEDPYLRSGELGIGLPITINESPDFIQRIQNAASKWKETRTDGNVHFDYNFENLVQGMK